MKKLAGLDGLRGLAAVYVVVHHAHLLENRGLGRLLYFGQEAVILFFLLSGFVIAYSSHFRRPTIVQYIGTRARRILPIYLAAIGISVASAYALGAPLRMDQIAAHLIMLQDVSSLKPGVWFSTFWNNSPTWSLAYEWWFYILFIPLGLQPLGRRLLNIRTSRRLAFLISVIGFVTYQARPNQISLYLGYFFIWWTGAELGRSYAERGEDSTPSERAVLFHLSAITALWCIPAFTANAWNQLGIAPALQARHHLAALLFVFFFLLKKQNIERIPGRLLTFFSLFAPISYAIYLIHQPILFLIKSTLPEYSAMFILAVCMVITIPLAWLLENPYQKMANRLLTSRAPQREHTSYGKAADQ